jgi:hypothetical protein
MRKREFFISRGGGQKILARKTICRKIFLYQNHMRTTCRAKRGRWVYEGGGLEQLRKVLEVVSLLIGVA